MTSTVNGGFKLKHINQSIIIRLMTSISSWLCDTAATGIMCWSSLIKFL